MKILRSATRRGFNVGAAGWFTVLRPNKWTAASRFPGTVRHLNQHPAPPPHPPQFDSDRLGGSVAVAPSLNSDLGAQHRNWLQFASIVLGAAAFTWFMLWWMMGARH